MSKYDIPDNESEKEVLPNKMGITDKEDIGQEEAKDLQELKSFFLKN